MKKQQETNARRRRTRLGRNGPTNHNTIRRLRQTNSRAAYQCIAGIARDSSQAQYNMVQSTLPCPFCRHPLTDALELPDGCVIYCSQCGYRGLSTSDGQA